MNKPKEKKTRAKVYTDKQGISHEITIEPNSEVKAWFDKVLTPPQEAEWEKELRQVYEAAASTDDRSDIDCVISYVKGLLQEQKEKFKEALGEMQVSRKCWRVYSKALSDAQEVLTKLKI